MFDLTADRARALDRVREWLGDPSRTSFLIEGGAGVGKTYLLGRILREALVSGIGIRCCCAPTHKACNVLRRKLDAFGIAWSYGYNPEQHVATDVITGTTAQLLGIAPIMGDDQSDDKIAFGRSRQGLLDRIMPHLLVIDEVSMVGVSDMLDLLKRGKTSGMKILVIGDAGQLPPVRDRVIPFDEFRSRAELREIVRQARGSAIVDIGWAIREGKPWQGLHGPGVERTPRIAAAFVERVEKPALDEESRSVFVAYRNKVVNGVQSLACRKLYGHDGRSFAQGELVLSEANYYSDDGEMRCTNQEDLIVDKFYEDEADEQTGIPVLLKRDGGFFRSNYISPEDLENRDHPYNVELRDRKTTALAFQEEYARLRNSPMHPLLANVDKKRKAAWRSYFVWKNQTIISFRHPFALTSHKSQGSTYREVFVDVNDLEHFDRHALYVAVTRPSTRLVLPDRPDPVYRLEDDPMFT